MAGRDVGGTVMAGAIILAVMGFVLLKSLADLLSLPMGVVIQCVAYTVVVLGMLVASILWGHMSKATRFSVAWPALLAFFFAAWWPALDQWNVRFEPPSILSYSNESMVIRGDAFWDSAWFLWGIFALLIAAYGWFLYAED